MNIFPCFQSQISNANEIMKKQSVEDIPSAVKGELVYIDEKFMQHNDIIKICGAQCTTDLELYFENIPAAVKGVLDDELVQLNVISKICGAKCRTDLEQSDENIPAAVKGALNDMDEKFMQHNGISKLVDSRCCV